MTAVSSFNPDPARLLAAALDASGAAAFTVDVSGHVHSWNRAAKALLRYTDAAIIGHHFSTFAPLEDFTSLADEASRANTAVTREMQFVAADGRVVRVALTIAPIEDGTGGVAGFLGLARSEEARIESELSMQMADARWRALIDAAVDGMIVIDRRGSIEAFNPAAERPLG